MFSIFNQCIALYYDLKSIYDFLSTDRVAAGRERKILDSYYLLLEGKYIIDVLKEKAISVNLPQDSQEIQDAIAMYQRVAYYFKEIEAGYYICLSATEKQTYLSKRHEKRILLEQNKEAIAKNLGSIAQVSISYEELGQAFGGILNEPYEKEEKIVGTTYKSSISLNGDVRLSKENNTLAITLPLNITLYSKKGKGWKKKKSVDANVYIPLELGEANNALGLSMGKIKVELGKIKIGFINIEPFVKNIVNKFLVKRYKPKLDAKLDQFLQWDHFIEGFQSQLEGMELTGAQPNTKVSLEETELFVRLDLNKDLDLKVNYDSLAEYIPQQTFSLPYLGAVNLESATLSFDNNVLSIGLNLTGGIDGTLNVKCLPIYDPQSGTIMIHDLNFDAETESFLLNVMVNSASGLKGMIPDFIQNWIKDLIKNQLLVIPAEAKLKDWIDELDVPYVNIDSAKINIFDVHFDEQGLSLKCGKSILPLSMFETDAEELNQDAASNDEPFVQLFPNNNGTGELRKLAGITDSTDPDPNFQFRCNKII